MGEAEGDVSPRRLVAADPSHRRQFDRNARTYLASLLKLDAGIARCIDSVPAAPRKLVTDHDAFGYFANRYGIDVVGAVIPSQTTQAQPAAKDLSELVGLIEREGVAAVFPESSLRADVVDAIAAQTGACADYTLYGDTLGPQCSDARPTWRWRRPTPTRWSAVSALGGMDAG